MKKLLTLSLIFLSTLLFSQNPTRVRGTNNLENIPSTKFSGNVVLGLKDIVEIDQLGLGVVPLYPLHIATTASDSHRNILIDNLISGSGKVDFGYTAWMSASNDTLAQTVYGHQTSIETYDATDIGYANYYDVHCDSNGGTQYGYFADADFVGVDLTNWYAFFARGRQLNVTGVKWGMYTLDLDSYIGCSDYATPTPPNLILDNGVLGETGDSGYLILRGNDGVADTQLDMAVKLDVTDTTDYKISFYNNAQGAEVASLDESGNLQIDGDFNLSGGDITQERGFNLIITIPDAAPSTDGTHITVKAGDSRTGVSPKTGGHLYLEAGSNNNSTGNGGNVYITSGDDDGGVGNGGDIVITAGKNISSANKGDLTIDAVNVVSTTATADFVSYKAGGTSPVSDATWPIYNDGVTSGQVTSITTKGGIITSIAVVP